CGFVRHVDLFGMWICSACGFVRHVDLAESQQVSFQQSKLKILIVSEREVNSFFVRFIQRLINRHILSFMFCQQKKN
ncbi:MAG: hypothetical protein NTZ60_00005, partial [Campylobacterales bacterium]|nr:hypothetical protein [Campylobacterales bacterium]